MRTTWQVGDQIQGRWEIFKILEGGAGIVYVVYDHAFREPFAAKTFKDEVFAASPLIADRFVREALAWTRLDVHPNLTQARMLESIDGKPFLFLEYVSGGDLGSWIGTPRLTEDLPRLLRFAIQFCDGMIHVLSRGIRAHRDIKPRNCLITNDGVLKVTDFGLAKLVDDGATAELPNPKSAKQGVNLTVTAVGTCTHMAPEQFANPGQVDLRVDVYSFGVMLYQMVMGELPFVGESWEELEHLHTTRPAPYPKTDPRLADIIQTCLAKDPSRRFSQFTQLRERLGEIYESVAGAPCPAPVQGAALSAVEWNNKGSSLDNLGRRTESIACYESAIRLDPTLASAWFNKGVALFATSNAGEALSCYEKALNINPNYEQAWSNKGVAFKGQGKIPEAMRCYERALSINPRYPNAWVNKGVALRALGKNQEALACYEQAVRLDPSNENGWANMGNAFCALGQPAKAIPCYERALGINPRMDVTWLNKGMALSALKMHSESLESYGRALEINPRLEQAWFLRGMTLVNELQSYREAVPCFEQAERLGSKEAKQALALCQGALARQ
jgi:tetratricopeptide (TPR) repeat protein